MNSLIKILFIISCATTDYYVAAQSAMLAYNNGLSTVTVSSGVEVTIQGGFTSSNVAVDGQIDNQGTINISGNFVNNNTTSAAFSTSAGTVNLNGITAAQSISAGSSIDPSFYSLILNNTFATSPQITFSVSSTVKNALTMTAGDISGGGSAIITLGTSAALPGTLTRTAGTIFNGTLKRWFATSAISAGSVAGLFPVGSSADYRPFSLSASGAPTTGGTISASHTAVAGGPVTVSFADGASTVVRRTSSYYTVSNGNGLAGGTYDLGIEGTNFGAIGNVADLRIVEAAVAAGGTAATNAGTTLNPQVNRTGLSLANITTKTFYIGSVNATTSPLPIQLLTFTAMRNKSVVDVFWTTATETNNGYFTVERSLDGLAFNSVFTTKGAGNSSKVINYSGVDLLPFQGLSYYRLKQTDFDGKYSYSNIVAVEFKSDNNFFTVFPNPTGVGEVPFLRFNTDETRDVLVVVYDESGKEIYSKVAIVEKGNGQVVAIDPSNTLAPGLYIISATSDNSIYRQKLIIK